MSMNPELKRLNIDPTEPPTNEEILRRLIRLAVGIVLVGQDALRDRLPEWEREAAQYLAEREAARKTAAATGWDVAVKAPPAPWFPKEWEYRLVGLAFATPRYMRDGFKQFARTQRNIWKKTAPLRRPLDWLGISDITQNWVEDMTERIKADMSELELVGKSEDEASRALGLIVINEVYEEVIKVLSDSPELRDLVAEQTQGISTEVIEEVRERAVSSDTLIEAVVHRMLRRPQVPPEKMVTGQKNKVPKS